MCNAWNHPPGCTCGWGGVGHQGKSSGGWKHSRGKQASVSPPLNRWQHYGDSLTNSSACPICRKSVYFIRSNGGAVWFDALISPWPKHFCFDTLDENAPLKQWSMNEINSTCMVHDLLNRCSEGIAQPILGIIVSIKAISNADYLVNVKCTDGSMKTANAGKGLNPSNLLGEFVLMSAHGKQVICTNSGMILSITDRSSILRILLRPRWYIFTILVCLVAWLYMSHQSVSIVLPTMEEQIAVPVQSMPPVNISNYAPQSSAIEQPISTEPLEKVQTPKQKPFVTKHLTVTVDGEAYKLDWQSASKPTKADLKRIQAEIRAANNKGKQEGRIIYQP